MRPEKKAIIEEIAGLLESAGFVFLVDYRGLTVDQLSELRRRLREFDGRMTVVKNRLLVRASQDAGGPDIGGLLIGPTAVVSAPGDAAQVAKMLKGFIKETTLPVIKGGQLGQQVLSAADIEAIALIPPREQLLGMLVGTIAAPMTQLVGVVQQKLASLVYVLKAVEEKKRENA